MAVYRIPPNRYRRRTPFVPSRNPLITATAQDSGVAYGTAASTVVLDFTAMGYATPYAIVAGLALAPSADGPRWGINAAVS
jgi:hypothetical protein